MHKAIRSQADDLQNEYSASTASDPTDWDDVARQEFKVEADVNEMLKRFGVVSNQRPIESGEIDYTIDLQQAIAAVTEAKAVWQRMPAEIKADFPTWQALLNAANTGDLKLRFEEKPVLPEVPREPPP